MKGKNKDYGHGKSYYQLFLAIIAISALVFVGCVSGEQPSNASNGGETVAPPQNGNSLPDGDPYKELIDDDAMKGDANAPVTIVEFSDFQCPYCGRYFSDTYAQIDEEYIQTGKVRYVFRDFPLSFHEHAQKASEAAECADDQGKFWEMHDMLFENQNALDVASLKTYAAELGLDTEEFGQCLDSGKYADEVKADMQAGADYGVSGTPAFLINGKLLVGAQPFSAFKEAIDAELE